jgi:tetraacyldisaccharide 4'-kinase
MARGADVAVLDDAFQHRRVRRAADIVLVSADRWSDAARLLPTGPYREPRRALRRADLVVVTRKAADAARADEVVENVTRIAPDVASAVVTLAPGELRRVDGAGSEPVSALAGARVAAIAAIGDPAAFTRQLGALGARVRAHVRPDHHRFTSDEVQRLASGLARDERPLCTLKDAVKLGPLWPREAPALWYVSQHLIVERGGEHLEELLTRVLRARHTHPLSPPAPLPATPS